MKILYRLSRPAFLLACAVALLALPASPLAAQRFRWVPLGPFGGQVQSFTIVPGQSGIVYAAGAGHGVFKSVNAGESWTAVLAADVQSGVAVDPARPSVLYVIAYPGGVLKSADAGAHWFAVNRNLPTFPGALASLAIDPANPNRIYASGLAGVFRTTDGGANWKLLNTGFPPGPAGPAIALAAVRRPAGTVFAGFESGLLRSADNGNTWSKLTRGLPTAMATYIVPAPSDPQTVYAYFRGVGLYRTLNGGNTWKPVLGPPSRNVYSLSIDPRSAETLYASIDGGIVRSTNGARSWTALAPLTGPRPSAVVADPAVPRRLYAGLSPDATVAGGVFRSDDAGATWVRRSEGYSDLEVRAFGVALNDPQALWANAGRLLFRSANGGVRWFRAALPEAAAPVPDGLAVASASTVYAHTGLPFPFENRLWRTRDAAASWTRVLSPQPPASLFHVRLAPSAPETLYAQAGRSQVDLAFDTLRSTDGGDHWEVRSGAPLTYCGPGDFVVAPSNEAILHVAAAVPGAVQTCYTPFAAVLRSDDAGGTFRNIGAGLPPGQVSRIAVDPGDPDVVFAGFARSFGFPGDGIWKTDDGGAHWARSGSGFAKRFVTALAASALPGRAWAALSVGDQVFLTEDGGITWQEVSAGLFGVEVQDLVADPGDPERVYAVTQNGVWLFTEDP